MSQTIETCSNHIHTACRGVLGFNQQRSSRLLLNAAPWPFGLFIKRRLMAQRAAVAALPAAVATSAAATSWWHCACAARVGLHALRDAALTLCRAVPDALFDAPSLPFCESPAASAGELRLGDGLPVASACCLQVQRECCQRFAASCMSAYLARPCAS